MNHIRNNIKDNFAQIPNALINDNTLSDRARFIFCYMAAKSDDWKFYQDKMAKDLKMSVDTVRKYIAELLQSGWVTREEIRGERGIFDSFVYDLHPSPCGKNTESVKNGVGKNPSPLNSALTNTVPLQTNTTTKKECKEPQKENSILTTVHDQVDETAVKVVEVIPSKDNPISREEFFERADAIHQVLEEEKKVRKTKAQKYIYPPTVEELVHPFYDKLIEKKRIHQNIVDCWNWANHQAEAFWLNHDKTGWKIERLNGAIATWINRAIQYKTVIVPCPVQYPNNPANTPAPTPTKLHADQTQLSDQARAERKAMFAAAKAELNQIGA